MSLLDESCTICGKVRRVCLGRPHVAPLEKTMSNANDLDAEKKFSPKGIAEPPRYAVPILRHFKHDHLPPHLARVSKPFADLAYAIVQGDNGPESGTVTFGPPIQNGPERQVALRKLLEAKDAAVRAVMEES